MIIKHFKNVMRHKYYVAVECFKIGLYWQGLTHDLSKFTPREFFTSAKYYQGNRSPLEAEREDKGYSEVFVHHKAKNKHHHVYWVDIDSGRAMPAKMPKKYALELVCDFVGAGRVYGGKKWNKHEPLKYWNEKIVKTQIHEETRKQIEGYLKQYSAYGKIISK